MNVGGLAPAVVAAALFIARHALAEEPAPPTFGDETVGTGVVPGEVVVDLLDDATDADVADLGARYGLALRDASGWGRTHDRIEIAEVDAAREDALLRALSGDGRVEHAEPMGLYRATFVPDDPLYESRQWHLAHVGAERAWSYSCGRGITVAVVDTGIACFDEGPFSRGTDLAGTRCRGGWNFVDDAPSAADDHGHGTHVAGTIAQTTDNAMGTAGLAFCATLMPVKVLSRGGFGSTASVAEGIRFAADNGAQVINLSLGGPLRSRILEDAVDHALSRGAVVVAAAGNSGRSVGWPAAYPGVLAVSATDDRDRIAWFSSRGPEVGIAAPGVSVTQQTVCNGGKDRCEIFGTFNGTSMASPHVAGAVAMVEALGVTEPSAVRRVLSVTAHPRGDAHLYGAGVLDAGAAAGRAFWGHVLLRGLALAGLMALLARRVRRRGGRMRLGGAAWLGALVTSVGLFPVAPLLGLRAPGRLHLLVELASRPLGEWDLLLAGQALHRWLLLSSALPALGLTALAFANRRARPIVGGVAMGSAALLAQLAWSGDVAFVFGPWLARIWTAGSALLCLWIARIALDAKGA